MKKRALNKDIIKEITTTMPRFLSITIMIALGVFVYVGLHSTGPMMRHTGNVFVDKNNMYDICINATFGLDGVDVSKINSKDGIKNIEYGYSRDLNISGQDILVRVESIARDAKISVPAISEGRNLEANDEILFDKYYKKGEFKLGDIVVFDKEDSKFKLDEDDDDLNNYKYKIVGFITTSDYMDTSFKGMSTSGYGSIDAFAYVLIDNFQCEDYSFAKIEFKDTEGFVTFDDEYKSLNKAHKLTYENILDDRPKVRLEKLKNEAYEKIDENEIKLIDAKKEIADNEKKLIDARQKIDEGASDLRKAEEDFNREVKKANDKIASSEVELKDARVKLDDAHATLAREEAKYLDGKKEYDEKYQEFLDGKKKYEEKYQEFLDGKKKYDDGVKELADAKKKLSDGSRELSEKSVDIVDGEKELDKARVILSQAEYDYQRAESEYNQGKANYDNQYSQFLAGKAYMTPAQVAQTEATLNMANLQLQAYDSKLKSAKAELNSAKTEFGKGEKELSDGYKKIADAKKKIKDGETEVADADKKLADAKIELEDGEKKLADAKIELDDGEQKLADAKIKLDDGEIKLSDAKRELADHEIEYQDGLVKLQDGKDTLERETIKGRNELDKAHKKIADANIEYDDGKREFDDKVPKAKLDIADGEKKIADARDLLKRLKEPSYSISTRDDNNQLFTFYDSASRLDLLSAVFPVFFYLISLFVSLTTMTRMVEERRTQIGTLKALGYSKWDIMKKYIVYGGVSSILGGIIGVFAGFKLLPSVIFNIYSSTFAARELVFEAYPKTYIIAVLIGILCNVLAALFVVNSSMRENASALMRPKAPKESKKILIEKIDALWRRLSFLQKVTLRNVFRYKKRMIMTILGIAGCTGLLFIGYALKDAMANVLTKQYIDVFKYDFLCVYDRDLGKHGTDEYLSTLNNSSIIESNVDIRVENLELLREHSTDQNVMLMCPTDIEAFQKLVYLKKVHGKPFELNDDGAVISEKLAYIAKISVGDTIRLRDDDKKYYDIKVSAITENYTSHYMYMTPAVYKQVFGRDIVNNANIISLNSNTEEKNDLFQTLLKQDIVLSVIDLVTSKELTDNFLGSLSFVVYIMIVCSSVLAFIVLYNLTNINISERIRELSTIKVLGFYPNEVTAYVYRETLMLTAFGIVAGYGLGYAIFYFIAMKLPPDNVMLVPKVDLGVFAISAALTFLFSLMVMFVVHKKLKGIDMVEALKSYD